MASSNYKFKKRIASVKTIEKITRAMKLVAIAKLQRSKKELMKKNEYFEVTREVVNKVLSIKDNIILNRAFKNKLSSKKKLLVLINSDLGFCGSLNNNLNKKFIEIFNKEHDVVIAFGKKAGKFLAKNKIPPKKQYDLISDSLFISDISIPSAEIHIEFKNTDYAEIILCYNHFINSITVEPITLSIWPFSDENKNLLKTQNEIKLDEKIPVTFEPDEADIVLNVFPYYLLIAIYSALVNSKVSEYALRRLTMSNASDNANSLIDELVLKSNRIRQSIITEEIAEIVTGAEA